jgi:hypothetical protein
MRAAVAAAALLGLAAAAPPARADEIVASRRMAFAERGADLVVSTTFGELFDRAALDALASGLPTTIVVRIYLYRDEEIPLALAALQLDVIYDLWDEVYVVRRQDPRGASTTRLRDRAAVVEAVTRLREVPVAPLARVPIGPHHFVALAAELNPVSEELLAEVRRWLTRRAGDRLDGGSSFFGSFVSIFVNPRLEAADRIVRLRSQPFYRVRR